jgi:hypothetical protein
LEESYLGIGHPGPAPKTTESFRVSQSFLAGLDTEKARKSCKVVADGGFE